MDADEHLGIAGARRVELLDAEHLRPTVLAKSDGPH
jgi:hypothetical protein